MKKPMIKDLANDLLQLFKSNPYLSVITVGGVPSRIEGDFSEGVKRGEFNVVINIPLNYPFGFPVLKEVGGGIPRTMDRHINEDGTCCVAVLQETIVRANKGIQVTAYVNEYVIPFLANQIYFKEYGNWCNGDYKHGNEGILQYYIELLEAKNSNEVLNILGYALNNIRLGRNDQCFCGSKKKFKACHSHKLDEINALGREQIQKDIRTIKLL